MSGLRSKYNPEALRVLDAALVEAELDGRGRIDPAHLLLATLDPGAAFAEVRNSNQPASAKAALPEPGAETAAARTVRFLDVEPELLRLTVQSRLRALRRPRHAARTPRSSRATRQALVFAVQEAQRQQARQIGAEHLLLGIARARRQSLPGWHQLFWELHRLRLLPDDMWEEVRRPSRATHIVVAEILDEFRLDLASLRVAAAQQNPLQAGLPWNSGVQAALDRAQKEASATGAGRVGAEHIWLGLLGDPGAAALLENSGLSLPVLEKHMRATLRSDAETASRKTRYTPEARRIFAAAERAALADSALLIDTGHLLAALGGSAPAAPFAERVAHIFAPLPASRARAALARAWDQSGATPGTGLGQLRTVLEQRTKPAAPSASPAPPADIPTRVNAIIAREFSRPAHSIGPETNLIHEAPSRIRILEVFQACMREFGIVLSLREIEPIQTAHQLARVVEAKMAATAKVLRRPASAPEKAYAFFAPSVVWIVLTALSSIGPEPISFQENFIPLSLLFGLIPCTMSYRRIAGFRPLAPFVVAGWLTLTTFLMFR